ncbi:Transcription factor TGA4 isoform F [Glycine soja]|uniref:Transcription factor TGA4 isoform F n=1 Tax=Glycine soja TaxID=3848 RepID=A0A445FMY2_GLYSO|nr:Transcription factor TGA4 isoform F [Glycine soja]
MNSASPQFVSSRRMSVYDPIHQISMWGEGFKSNGNLSAAMPLIDETDMKFDSQSEDASHGILGEPNKYDQEANKPTDKGDNDKYVSPAILDFEESVFNLDIQRRLAQNREAARKSRLRKKAYVQQLESSRLKLMQLEQELERARQQGIYIGGGLDSNHLGFAGSVNSGITTFEMEYGHWVNEQNRQITELRNALNAHIGDVELRILVDGMMSHYAEMFRMKSAAAKADVFYVMSGMWKTTAERFFLWIGGFRPSELLKVLGPLIEPLTEQQRLDIYNLGQSCQQAEDALSQGMDKLRQTLADSVAAGQFMEGTYIPQMTSAMDKLKALVSFVNQADHLRQETLQQMSRILTIRQAARCLLALGEYFQRLRALSSLWSNRPREPA